MSSELLIIEVDGMCVTGALYAKDAAPIAEPFCADYNGTGAGLCTAVEEVIDLAQGASVELGRALSGIKESVYLSLSPRLLHFRILELPFIDKKKILEVLPLELSGMFSIETDAVVLDAVVLTRGRVLAVGVEKDFLRTVLGQLKEVGVEPLWVGSALFCVAGLDTLSDSGAALVVGPDFIAAIENGRPVFYNSIELGGTCASSVAYIHAAGIEFDSVLTVGVDVSNIAALDGKEKSIKAVEEASYKNRLFGALAKDISAGRIADNVNFAKGEFACKRGRKKLKAKLIMTAALVAVIVLLVFGNLYLRYARYSATLSSVKRSMLVSYKEIFPQHNSASVTDPLYFLEAKMKEANLQSSQVTGISPLSVLLFLTSADKSNSADKIKITAASVVKEKITAAGSAATFESANRYKEALSALKIGTVRMADVKSRAGGGVDFSITILR